MARNWFLYTKSIMQHFFDSSQEYINQKPNVIEAKKYDLKRKSKLMLDISERYGTKTEITEELGHTCGLVTSSFSSFILTGLTHAPEPSYIVREAMGEPAGPHGFFVSA